MAVTVTVYTYIRNVLGLAPITCMLCVHPSVGSSLIGSTPGLLSAFSLRLQLELELERVHSSCLRSILGVRLSDRHTNEHIRKSCGVATLSAYITANRLRWLGHVGRMEEGRLPHIALFSSLHGDMTRPVGRPRHTWEKCVCADLKVLGQDEGSWEASCQIKSAWRKRLWDLTHPWESQRLVRCRRRTKQAIDKHVERYVVPFSGWEDGGSPVPRWWEPPPAPTRVVLDPAASPPPMCDGSGAGFGF